ncbi:MAG TPA: hypothetical protein VFX92_05280 [Candidatus Krumholzibacteria bacterium]|nr:hypothetical protein [Candidatus Krumholzibacteria bacterium]
MRKIHLLIATATVVAIACGTRSRAGDDAIVVRCGVNMGIIADDGVRTDWGGSAAWTAELRADTLSLRRTGRCGDECTYTEEVVLSDVGSACPRLVAARRIRRESGSPAGRTETVLRAAHGTLDIQDWKVPYGRVSGRLQTELALTFLVELDSLETE